MSNDLSEADFNEITASEPETITVTERCLAADHYEHEAESAAMRCW